jgi:flagellar biosynthesis/type III secretory pathway chaperone
MRPDPDSTRRQLVELIGRSVYQALGLKESLEDEFRALESQDMDALSGALENKTRCVEQLRLLEEQRQACCTAAGIAPDAEQMDRMTAWCDEDSVVADGWQHLLDVAAQCASLNLTNGAIIHARKQQIETGLAVIRGGSPDPAVYARSGVRPDRPSLRSLGEA